MTFNYKNFDNEQHIKLMKTIIQNGGTVLPRGIKTKELTNVKIVLEKNVETEINVDYDYINEIYKSMVSSDEISIKKDLFHYSGFRSRMSEILEILKNDISSRQAVLKLREDSCIISFQFLVRGSYMDIIVNSRSTDAYKKLSTDIGLSKFLLAAFSHVLEVKEGKVILNTTSLHVYERDIEEIKKLGDKNEK